MNKCPWAGNDPLYVAYHDNEWGSPVHDDRTLFGFLLLEGAQAGLSWITILKKRDNYRKAFDNFDPELVAKYDLDKIESLMSDAGIIRNRRKIEAAVINARLFLEVCKEFGSFDAYIWSFVGGKPLKNSWSSMSEIPVKTELSDALSRNLVKRGFKFVGSTICYSYMQAVGLINDHLVSCFRYEEV